MLSRVILFVGLAATSAAAADPPGYVVWPKGLPPENSPHKIQFEHHSWSLAHREKSGVVESHLTRTVVMIVQSGEATLVVGADVVDPRTHLRRSSAALRFAMESKERSRQAMSSTCRPDCRTSVFWSPASRSLILNVTYYIDVVVNAHFLGLMPLTNSKLETSKRMAYSAYKMACFAYRNSTEPSTSQKV
jgi:hypothetical protein